MSFSDEATVARFWSYIGDHSSSVACWPWLGWKSKGYGGFWNHNRSVRAHRFSYELLREPIPEGLTLDHLCRNRACVNPAHLEPVTHRVNVLRGIGLSAQNARKRTCKYGHPFDGHNVSVAADGERTCVMCRRRRDHELLTRRPWGVQLPTRARTHCPLGHAYAGANLYVDPRGRRNCRTCDRLKHARKYWNRESAPISDGALERASADV
jgi:hypothetical protein